jgi:hypothetical protein
LGPGTYTIKFVIEDVSDLQVDSALFIPTGSLKLFPLQHGDYNGDGSVNSADYDIWVANYGDSPADYYDGDGSGNGVVDSADFSVWRLHLGMTGNKDFCADFNRSGTLTNADATNMVMGLTECASRFEGDADGDGDVDNCDLQIFQTEDMSDVPLRPCACSEGSGGGGGSLLTGGDKDPAILKEQLPESPDVDGDGDVDQTDFAALNAIVHGASSDPQAANEAGSDPTPSEATQSEPQPHEVTPPAQEQSLLPPGASR